MVMFHLLCCFGSGFVVFEFTESVLKEAKHSLVPEVNRVITDDSEEQIIIVYMIIIIINTHSVFVGGFVRV